MLSMMDLAYSTGSCPTIDTCRLRATQRTRRSIDRRSGRQRRRQVMGYGRDDGLESRRVSRPRDRT